MISFVLTESKINRFAADRIEKSKEEAEKYLLTLKGEPLVALVYDGIVTIDGAKFEAIFVKGFDINNEKGVLLAQRYIPKSFFKKFEVVGNPLEIERPQNLLYQSNTI
ncbi:MAG: hypothetical protein WCT02_02765 [Candidatus Paceibacterota bacterium]